MQWRERIDNCWNRGRRTRTGIWIQDCNALLAGFVLEETLFGAVVPRAGQARKVDE